MRKATDLIIEADKALLKAVDAAIEHAVTTAGTEFQLLGSHRSPHEYFADAVLRHAFLRVCGADLEVYSGGDPGTAWKILYAGRNVARGWERERGKLAVLREKAERQEDMEKDASERRQLAASAQNFALRNIIRALVDHVRASDPQITERLKATVEARLERVENPSNTDLEFTELAKTYVSLFTAPSEEQPGSEPRYPNNKP